MIITVLTLFPEIFSPVLSSSIVGRAQKKKIISINFINIRNFALDRHKTVDDKPYGGGTGMIMRVDIVKKAIDNSRIALCKKEKVVLMDPKGETFNQPTARKYSKLDHLILVCGHYEGIDSRIYNFVDEVVSIGRYVLTGGEIPAMVIVDSVVRLIPHVLTKPEAIQDESFSQINKIEYPQYTRPSDFEGFKVPEVLISGNHNKISKWKEDNKTQE